MMRDPVGSDSIGTTSETTNGQADYRICSAERRRRWGGSVQTGGRHASRRIAMTVEGSDRLMTMADLSEMLEIPVNTLYGWRCRGARAARLPYRPLRPLSPICRRNPGSSSKPTNRHRSGAEHGQCPARRFSVKDSSGRMRTVTRYRVRYRDWSGIEHGETFKRAGDAARRKAQVETELAGGTWRDPETRRNPSRSVGHGLDREPATICGSTTRARLETTMRAQVLPKFGGLPLVKISNAAVRGWVTEMLGADLSPATARKAVFALRRLPRRSGLRRTVDA